MKKIVSGFSIAVVVGTAFALLSCSDSKPDKEKSGPGVPVVQVTNYPLFYFAKQIGGERIDLRFLPGQADGDPAFWEPGDEEILALQSADLIIINGASYEKWRERVSLPDSKIVDTSEAFSGEFLSSGEVVTHSHGADGEHSHGGIAFTTWMDMQQAIWQAEEVLNGLIRVAPEHEAEFARKFDQLADRIDELHQGFKAQGARLEEVPLVTSHPVYQYFARRYGLNQKYVHWEPETVPDGDALDELREILAEHPAKWMVWEGSPAPESVTLLKDMGLQSVVIDPCGNRPGEGDWLSVMQVNLANLEKLVP